jgi:hypothetical protein
MFWRWRGVPAQAGPLPGILLAAELAQRENIPGRPGYPEYLPMPIDCSCPKCNHRYKISDELVGKTVLCQKCQTRFKAKATVPVVSASRVTASPVPLWLRIGFGFSLLLSGSAIALVVLFALSGHRALQKQAENTESLQRQVQEVKVSLLTLSAAAMKPPAQPEPQEQQQAAVTVTPTVSAEDRIDFDGTVDALWNDYAADMLKADLKYNGKRLLLSGVTGRVEKNKTGQYLILTCYRRSPAAANQGARFVSPEEAAQMVYQSAARASTIPAVALLLDHKELDSFAGLDASKPIRITGICKGARRDETSVPAYFVLVDQCRLARK